MSSSVLLCPLWRPISQRTKLNSSYLKVCCSVQDHQLCKQVQAPQVFLSPPSSSMAVKHGPYLLTLWKRSRPLKPRAWGNLSASPTWSARSTTGCRARSTPLWVHRNQETETCIVRACHMLQQPLQNILQGTLEGGWCCCWQRKCWMDNIKERTSLPMPELFTRASCRKDWKRISALSLMSHWWPNQSRDWTEL